MRRTRRNRNQQPPFVVPVVFGFTANTQFGQLIGQDLLTATDRDYVHRHAVTLAEETQELGQVAALVCRDRRRVAVLVAIPVVEVELGTGRGGLVLVLGVEASRQHEAQSELLLHATEAVATSLRTVFPGHSMAESANTMTRALQHHTDTGQIVELRRQLRSQARCFSFLAGGRPVAANEVVQPTESALMLAKMLLARLRGTRRVQLGYLLPLQRFEGSMRPRGQVIAYRLNAEELYVCQSLRMQNWLRRDAT